MIAGTAPEVDIRIHNLIDPAKCYDFLRKKRWPHGTCCPECTSDTLIHNVRRRGKALLPSLVGILLATAG